MKYKNIIFDVGDVLLQYRWKDMLDESIAKSKIIEMLKTYRYGKDSE